MNILNEFKKELGYCNVVNQYIELSQRSIQDELKRKITETFTLKDYAKQYGLNICELHSELGLRIAQNYIVNIHTSFALFIERYSSLSASPVVNSDKSDLYSILKTVYNNNIPKRVEILFYICDFYRLVRNNIIHGTADDKIAAYKTAKTTLDNRRNNVDLRDIVGKLDALHESEFLTFDDQVLFSKVTAELAERIYRDTKYDLVAHAKKNFKTIDKMTAQYHNNIDRFCSILDSYFKRKYPIQTEQYTDQYIEIKNLMKKQPMGI